MPCPAVHCLRGGTLVDAANAWSGVLTCRCVDLQFAVALDELQGIPMVIAEPAQPLVAADEQTQPAVEDDAADVAKRPLGGAEGGQRRLEELINLPSLNIRGLASAAVEEEARNVIPATAKASLDIRLVQGMDHLVTVERIIEHIRRQGFYVTEVEPGEEVRLFYSKVCKVTRDRGYNAVRTSMDLGISRRLIAAVQRARGPVIKLPTLGGSLPVHVFEEILGARAIIVPIANHDNNQHSHNENIRLQNLWDGIETMAALLALDAGEPGTE